MTVQKRKNRGCFFLSVSCFRLRLSLKSRSVQYAALDELLDKLLFLAVSGDGQLPKMNNCIPSDVDN